MPAFGDHLGVGIPSVATLPRNDSALTFTTARFPVPGSFSRDSLLLPSKGT